MPLTLPPPSGHSGHPVGLAHRPVTALLGGPARLPLAEGAENVLGGQWRLRLPADRTTVHRGHGELCYGEPWVGG